jgi:hypothetical protein
MFFFYIFVLFICLFVNLFVVVVEEQNGKKEVTPITNLSRIATNVLEISQLNATNVLRTGP